ncbi:hypothetical protein KUTeg_019590 [Tegillarca granosa]|uniref:Katanin p80 subunit C-terminal domain-containing protein n=1 Tax=Tegillarca granosa TaxID=220873 RepID=A0ABQ9EF33_TEGGR|nr:hypothetical protein KUTeg_019590 [Tegillarca granosa]
MYFYFYVTTVCSSLKVVLKNFGPVIKANLTAPPSVGVDITREERNDGYMFIVSLRERHLKKKRNVHF